jgi:hypothetical protein
MSSTPTSTLEPTPRRRVASRLVDWLDRVREMRRGWGTTDEERSRFYECERYVAPPVDTYYRAIDVDAPREVVWRWLCQMHVAPYSWDWIDNAGRQSPRRLIPGLENLAVGQRMLTIFRLVEFEHGNQMTMHIEPRHKWFWGDVGCTYQVESRGSGGSRIIYVWCVCVRRGTFGRVTGLQYLRKATAPLGELLMASKQLRTFKQLAEAQARAGIPHETAAGQPDAAAR